MSHIALQPQLIRLTRFKRAFDSLSHVEDAERRRLQRVLHDEESRLLSRENSCETCRKSVNKWGVYERKNDRPRYYCYDCAGGKENICPTCLTVSAAGISACHRCGERNTCFKCSTACGRGMLCVGCADEDSAPVECVEEKE